MDYETEIPFKGDEKKALDVSLNVFISQGFEIVDKRDTSYELMGPGMWSTRQNPLVGISRVMVNAYSDRIKLRAEFGGIKKMQTFLLALICGMALFFIILFGYLFRDAPGYSIFIPLAPFFPWPFLIPIMVRVMKKRTLRAIDTFFKNMNALG